MSDPLGTFEVGSVALAASTSTSLRSMEPLTLKDPVICVLSSTFTPEPETEKDPVIPRDPDIWAAPENGNVEPAPFRAYEAVTALLAQDAVATKLAVWARVTNDAVCAEVAREAVLTKEALTACST